MKEHKSLEFKTFVSKTFLKSVSAFANFCEGQIIFDVSDDGEIRGLYDDLNQLCLDIENMINDSIQPKPDFSIDINSKNKTITLTVYEGYYKPYLYNGKSLATSSLLKQIVSRYKVSLDKVESEDDKRDFIVVDTVQ